MPFTLEALQANEGDCLILHYGPKKSPKFIVIDGGSRGIYKRSLKPRLESLRTKWGKDGVLNLEMVMISHIDGDHITGILDWTDELVGLMDDDSDLPDNIISTWYNSFDEIVGNEGTEIFTKLGQQAAAAASTEAAAKTLGIQPHSAALIASVPQGRRVRANFEKLSIALNEDRGLIMQPAAGSPVVEWDEDLKLTVIAPEETRVRKLHKEWEKELKKNPRMSPAQAAAFADDSPYNLSSIVVLAESKKKKMLLTGDARGDDVLAGLTKAKLLKTDADKLHVHLLKVPHHGSIHNVDTVFFERITADHYVVSADGLHNNPDIDTLEMIAAARPDDKFTLYLTNREGKKNLAAKLAKFEKAMKKAKRKFGLVYGEGEPVKMVRVDLADKVTY